jgi:hypothetical protein
MVNEDILGRGSTVRQARTSITWDEKADLLTC